MNWRTTSKDLIILTLILSVLFGMSLGAFPLHTPDAARYAEIPREMLASGDYITPHLNGLEYFEKPPLFYWLQAINLNLFGVNVFAANLANAIMSFFTCLLVYFAASKLYSNRTGFISAIILATSMLFFGMSRITTIDMALTFFMAAALMCFILGANAPQPPILEKSSKQSRSRHYYIPASFAAMSFAVMAKGLVGFVFPMAIISLWTIFFGRWRNIKIWDIVVGICLFLLIAAPWHIIMQIRHPDFFHFYFIEQHFLRYLTSYAGREQAWWFLPLVLIGGFYPWTAFILQAIKTQLHFPFNFKKQPQTEWQHAKQQSSEQQKWQQTKNAIYFVLWALIIFVFYSFSNSQLIPYLLPIFPALAILTGNYFALHWEEKHATSFAIGFYAFAIINIALGILLLNAPNLLSLSENFYISLPFFAAAMLFIIGGIASALSYYCYGIAKGFVALATVMITILLISTPLLHSVIQKTTLPFAAYLKPKLQKEDEVASFKNYYQDLPYYLERHITVVDYRGELAFGAEHYEAKNESDNWMIGQKTFWSRWNSSKKMYMIMDVDDYETMSAKFIKQNHIHQLMKYDDKILVTNQPS